MTARPASTIATEIDRATDGATDGAIDGAIDGGLLWDTVRKFPTGIAVVTAGRGDRARGATVSTFTFVSRQPPLVSVCLAAGSTMLDVLGRSGTFAVNLLSSHQAGLARHFASRGRGAGQFDGVPCTAGQRDRVPLLIGAVGWLGCGFERAIRLGDHVLVLGRVVEAVAGDADPLLYFSGRFYAGVDKELRV